MSEHIPELDAEIVPLRTPLDDSIRNLIEEARIQPELSTEELIGLFGEEHVKAYFSNPDVYEGGDHAA